MNKSPTSSGLLRELMRERFFRYKKIFEPNTRIIEESDKNSIQENDRTDRDISTNDKSVKLFAVLLLPEWLNLISWTEISLNNRVCAINSGDMDQEKFKEMVLKAPQLNFSDESGYVVAELKDFGFDPKKLNFTLRIGNVVNFFGMSEHANRLLGPESTRANCKLSAPIFEPLWNSFKRDLEKKSADRRGRTFLKSLGLKEFKHIELTKEFVSKWYEGVESPLSSDQSSKLETLSGRTTYGWMCALIALSKVTRNIENIREELNVAKKIFNEEKKYSITEPILYNCNDKLFSTIKKLSYIEDDCKINFASAAMIFNYMDIFKSGKMPELENLLLDLSMLKVLCKEDEIINETAFYIGRLIPDSVNSSIFYNSGITKTNLLKDNKVLNLSLDERYKKILRKYGNEKDSVVDSDSRTRRTELSSGDAGQKHLFEPDT